MSFGQFFHVLRGRIWMIILIFLFVVGSVTAVTAVMPKLYNAQATVILNYKGADPVTGNPLPSQSMPGQLAIAIATQVDIIKSNAVAQTVVNDLKLTDSEQWRARYTEAQVSDGSPIGNWIAQRLLRNVKIEPSRESNVFRIGYRDGDPVQAANIANAFASAYQKISVQLNVEPSRMAAIYFNARLAELRNRVETSNQKVSQYQQDNGIVSATGADHESMRLNELSTQLVAVQSQLSEAASRAGHAIGNAPASSDVETNPTVRHLTEELAAAEQRLAILKSKFTSEHPQYQSSVAEIANLRKALAAQRGSTSRTVRNNANVLIEKEAELQQALAAQKEKVLKLNRQRNELNILRQEADSAQRAYDTAANRLMANNFAGQANLSEVTILSAAVTPSKPFRPKPLLYIALSIILGAVLGVMGAIVIELFDRRARSTQDLIDLLQAPVLGVLSQPAMTSSRRMLAR